MPIVNMIYINKSKPATAISLDKSSISLTTVGQTEKLTATVTPPDTTSKISWSSSDTSIATVSQTGLVTCVTPGECTITVSTSNGLSATCNVMGATVLFDYGDWTNSVWSDEGYVSKYTDKVTIYSSSGYASVYLSQYQIDLTKDFLLEMNAYLPNTSAGYHYLGLWSSSSNDICFGTRWEGGSNMCVIYNNSWTYTGYYNPGTADYFIRKQGTTITMGFNGNTISTATYTATSGLYLYVSVYRDTCTINTAKLTYL